MHWQFGGNLEPVRMICEVDWRECPKAVANYVWSEIITDVLECLRNESVAWRVLGVFLVFAVVLHTMTRCKVKRETRDAIDKDVLNKVGYKVEDLELKVNILTYKLQYGAWPLPHQVRKSNFRKNLRNLRLTLSNPSDRNDWIKHVLLSPRRNESRVSCKYYPSEHCLTELFDAKKRNTLPYLRQEKLQVEHSSKSSKSSSDKSLKLSPVFTVNRKRRENLEMQHRNAISLPLFSKRRNGKSARKWRKDFRIDDQLTPACRSYAKTMDDCKRYLKELHDSNKNLGLVCSSSEISNESSVRNVFSDTQQQRSVEAGDLIDSSAPRKPENEESCRGNVGQNSQEPCLELSNAIYPVLRLLDKRLPSSQMNMNVNVFSRSTASSALMPICRELGNLAPSSQEALYQVKKKLESLHNVLRMYELQSVSGKSEKEKKQNFDALVSSIAKEDFDRAGNGKGEDDFGKRTSTSCEQGESDETGRSSVVSIRVFDEPRCFLTRKASPNRRLEQLVYSSDVGYERIPERIYYAISGESLEDGEENFAESRWKEVGFRAEFPVPMETDEDAILSAASSRTELSKDSELEDKPTAVLLREALQFKKALLTRVELEKVCFPPNGEEETGNEQRCSRVDGSPRSKFLDIISEEQSVSSSTEKTSRTYMFFNLQQERPLASFARQRIVGEPSKRFAGSKENLETPSEYFSFSDVNQAANADESFDGPENVRGNQGDELSKFASCSNATRADFASETRFNEFVERNVSSVELFSQDLDEAPLSEDKRSEFPKVANESSQVDGYFEDSEIVPCNPNLILKRNPGACSLIEKTSLARLRQMKTPNDEPRYEVSASESKETNLVQGSTSSSLNRSNDSNVEPSSMTVLIDRAVDEGKSKASILGRDFIHERSANTCSTNTRTLPKYDATKAGDYKRSDERIASRTEENSSTNLVEESNRAAEFYKSISNLISPHSSAYFTDEASSSATKLNLKEDGGENPKVRSCNDVRVEENSPEAGNIEAGYDGNANLVRETESRGEANDRRGSRAGDYGSSTMGTVSRERTPLNSPRIKTSTERYSISPSSSPREATTRSKSHGSHESHGRPRKSTRAKGLKSDEAKRNPESNANSVFVELQDFSELSRGTEQAPTVDQKRSKSQVSFKMEEPLDGNSKLRGHAKSLSPTPKTSSRSCIPILKSRLEAARRTEGESRPKSPARGPLTIATCCRDGSREREEIQAEGKSRNATAAAKDSHDHGKQQQQQQDAARRPRTRSIGDEAGQQEQMVIYVNIFTKYDRDSTRIVDPSKFLELVKSRKFAGDKKEVGEARESSENEKIVTVVSSVINGNLLDETTSSCLSTTRDDEALNEKLRNVCLLSVEQREIDVTAKPSVIDTSTSISDLENVSGVARNKFRISGTPRELSSEEYVALLEILHQEPNFVHLQELQSVCRKLLASAYPKI